MTDSISNDERRELKLSFDLFDDNNTGVVSASQIGMIIRACGENPSEARIAAIVEKANEKDGTVSFDDFLEIIIDLRTNEKRITVSDLEAAFKVFDTNNTGTIHKDELQRVLTNLGEKLNQQEMAEFFKLAQPSPDGAVDYERLAKVLIP